MNIPYELHLLRRRFPTVTLWFGHTTRHFWALVDDRLIEATTPQELANAINDTRIRQSPALGAAGSKVADARRTALAQTQGAWVDVAL
ncbi:hypothetical protein [Actinomadura alba]|uniref:Uncharacterized protein n=1 Tax=Actinomadura alba TaxID=406431 RepID=A0ABR7LPW7_9ACTN|nr:hypothetical protein [Actinomadura alba]MBC6466713.1 hypothetical protein [Actinomadura alba]